MLDEANGLYYKGNEIVDLTSMELALLSYMIENKDKLIPHQIILKHLYGSYDKSYLKCLYQTVCRLNKKLRGEIMILSRTSVGYRIYYMGE